MGPKHRVVVGVDGSSAGVRALDVAAGVADRADAALQIGSAWDLPAADSSACSYWQTALVDSDWARTDWARTDWARTQHEVAAKAVASAADRARSRHPGLVVTSQVFQRSAGAVLTDTSRDADLLVVASRGLGGFAGLVLGSVSHTAIHGCVPCHGRPQLDIEPTHDRPG